MNAREEGSTPDEASAAAGRYMAQAEHLVHPRDGQPDGSTAGSDRID
ncbi:hypothetical protein [Micromonospora thermarum]|nr:hypothetical protein [Micromonospora thermarum]